MHLLPFISVDNWEFSVPEFHNYNASSNFQSLKEINHEVGSMETEKGDVCAADINEEMCIRSAGRCRLKGI
jgi:hypothetical protein